ncbi:MAG: SIMPL domain-containing protein [Prevotella sp.]|jgi:uncharacterized protein YggE|nr:SIMPL domain-containing protein [Prevotella sp.]
MKKSFLYLFILSLLFTACTNPYNKKEKDAGFIEVSGSAEMEIEPDQIHLSVTVGNYSQKQANGTSREILSLESADKKFMDILSAVGIEKDKIVLKNALTNNYWTYYLRYRRYMENVRLEKEYEIVLNDVAKLNDLLSKLPGPEQGIVSVNLSELKNSKIEEYRKEVKMMAMKAAKEKASYLLESIGNKAGKPIYVREVEDNKADVYMNEAYSNKMMVRQESAMMQDEQEQIGLKKIKLKYEIEAKFEIQ